MAKKTGKIRSAELFKTLEQRSRGYALTEDAETQLPPVNAEDEPLDLTSLGQQPIQMVQDTSRTLRMKKFRSQLFAHWLVNLFEPCRAADIGGGKGLVSYLLMQHGWSATVIDPFDQPLPDKYKDIQAGQRVKIPEQAKIPRVEAPFEVEMAVDFDLLIGMHAHGCNAKIIDAAAKYGCGFVLFPCCVIDEPFFPRLGVHWLEALADYAQFKGQDVFPFRLNFKGQNIGICHVGKCQIKPSASG